MPREGRVIEQEQEWAVLYALIRQYPSGLYAAQLQEICDLPHSQRASGILRKLEGSHLAVGELDGRRKMWWAERAAIDAFAIFCEAHPVLAATWSSAPEPSKGEWR